MSGFFVGPFVYFHALCVRTAKALARLRECAGSPEPSLVAYVISTIISWAGSFRYNFLYGFAVAGQRASPIILWFRNCVLCRSVLSIIGSSHLGKGSLSFCWQPPCISSCCGIAFIFSSCRRSAAFCDLCSSWKSFY